MNTENFDRVDWMEYLADVRKNNGIRLDENKERIDLIPPEAIFSFAKVLTKGTAKYPSRNWEKGMDWGRVYGAAQRHLWKWWNGEDTDPETGESHLAHAITNVGFLLAYEARGVGTDDRPERLAG